jgi:hypothetical protein
MQLIPLVTLFVAAQQAYSAAVEPRSSNGIKYVKEPKHFTSAFHTRAVNTTIITNAGEPVAGQVGAYGQFSFKVNSDKNIICWDITTVGVTGEYQSPAVTATHIHQARAGAAGPPRIAFANPEYVSTNAMGAEVRRSKGCQQAPFVTGVLANNGAGPDTGSASGFTLKQIEEDPAAFFADTHTVAFSAGAVRGQLNPSELEVSCPKSFTSTIRTEATGSQIISTLTNAPVAGAANGKGYYELRINTDEDIVCYDIVLTGSDISTDYSSPAKTATHTHQGVFGRNGPPRLAYKNPTTQKSSNILSKIIKKLTHGKSSKNARRSKACIKGPFTTGVIDASTGKDSGSASGFTLAALESNPTGFFSDVHTVQFSQGAVRGNMYRA